MSLRYATCVFPSSSREYTYLCDIDAVKVGDRVLVDTGYATVVSLSTRNPRSGYRGPFKAILSLREITPEDRKKEIVARLEQIERLELLAKRFNALKSPEAKKLVAEYKRLSK